ncbi:hypothetical protein QVM50_29465, partial [Pseudomonas aeruginosa]
SVSKWPWNECPSQRGLGVQVRMESPQVRLKTAGYEAELKELPRGQRDFWVRVAPGSRRLVDEQLLQELARDFKGLQHQIMSCKGVASP